ncbi:MAG: transcription antitermination factor NusB [Lutibacter sp.]|uniref:transcription antitermination factor NusB n=1 Tax=Lutibacter sp. TaxID=1925666 RepID=UPI00183D8F8D|nr:transcription antitermination factor NusB [Lutibacter sp.]MBT8317043.1 transcription antitermination factor NusB [Lutibacter sp.]NNJ57903.1 transcription antitermination factor NusB [Lutibacter sp.]
MINRRHIRVKVMQSVYALLQSKSDNLDKEEKFLYASIDKLYDLYALVLRLLVEVRNLEKKQIEISQKKHLATAEELKPNSKFIDIEIFKLLSESVSLSTYLEKNSLNYWDLDSEYVHEILKLTKKSELYISFMKAESSSFQEEKEFVVALFKEIIAPNEKLADYFEDKSISWVDDIPFVNTWIVKTLNQIKPNRAFHLGNLYKDIDDKNFVVDLFRKVVLNHTEYEDDIKDKTPNWDSDRIADIDMILIKMAICEFLKFPSVPARVTINEYIEISKDYSTEKSSFFINGVLDKILKDFTASKRLSKIGRGLL